MARQRIVFALLMGVVTTCFISFVLVTINVGFGPMFVATWLRSWGLAYLVVVPMMVLVAPRVRAVVDGRVAGATARRAVFALGMGVITTCLISCVLVAVNLGFNDGFVRVWLRSWGVAYLAVIPALMFVAPWVQGRVDRMFAAKPDA